MSKTSKNTKTICCNNKCKNTKCQKYTKNKTCTTNATNITNHKIIKTWQKQYVVQTNAKNTYKNMSKQIQTILKHVQTMKQTYQTNDKHVKTDKNMLCTQMQNTYKTCQTVYTQ